MRGNFIELGWSTVIGSPSVMLGILLRDIFSQFDPVYREQVFVTDVPQLTLSIQRINGGVHK